MPNSKFGNWDEMFDKSHCEGLQVKLKSDMDFELYFEPERHLSDGEPGGVEGKSIARSNVSMEALSI